MGHTGRTPREAVSGAVAGSWARPGLARASPFVFLSGRADGRLPLANSGLGEALRSPVCFLEKGSLRCQLGTKLAGCFKPMFLKSVNESWKVYLF